MDPAFRKGGGTLAERGGGGSGLRGRGPLLKKGGPLLKKWGGGGGPDPLDPPMLWCSGHSWVCCHCRHMLVNALQIAVVVGLAYDCIPHETRGVLWFSSCRLSTITAVDT